jgi:hypothetical protein
MSLLKGAIMPELFEVFMVLSFGVSWPMSILKSYKAKTAKGKSQFFLCMILFGYACGITSKLLSGKINYVIGFYILNFFMVGIDLILYFRNQRLDQLTEA